MEIIDKQQDPLWRIAKKRAGFKIHLANYIVVNAFLWAIWYFTGRGYMWPIWPTLGWGVGVAFNYISAYELDKRDLVQREYERLKNENR